MTVVYRKKKTRKWSRNYRYGDYVAKLHEDKKKELATARTDVTSVLSQILKQKSDDYWENFALPILRKMHKEMMALGNVPSIMDSKAVIHYCVKLFDIASRHQDLLNGELQCAPLEKLEAYAKFRNDLYYCGRHEVDDLRKDSSGKFLPYWNTTSKKERISIDTIQFGPELGFERKPARYWLSLSKKERVKVQEVRTYPFGGQTSEEKYIWATDALVRTGIHNLCTVAHRELTSELNDLLS